MVKNTTGGTGTKSLARKHQGRGGGNALRIPETPDLEIFGFVSKMLGNGMCEIMTNDEKRLIGHIRNKFRGKQMRHNKLSSNSIVLVGLREWENPAKNCDILTIYDDSEIDQLQNMPNLNIDRLVQQRFSSTFQSKMSSAADVTFSHDDVIDEEMIQRVPKEDINFQMGSFEDIDVDDI